MKTSVYESLTTQTIWDVALMQYGSTEGIKEILLLNPQHLKDDGRLEQYNVSHTIASEVAIVKRVKTEMLIVVPCSEGNPKGAQAWVQNDGTTTWDDPYWETETEID